MSIHISQLLCQTYYNSIKLHILLNVRRNIASISKICSILLRELFFAERATNKMLSNESSTIFLFLNIQVLQLDLILKFASNAQSDSAARMLCKHPYKKLDLYLFWLRQRGIPLPIHLLFLPSDEEISKVALKMRDCHLKIINWYYATK